MNICLQQSASIQPRTNLQRCIRICSHSPYVNVQTYYFRSLFRGLLSVSSELRSRNEHCAGSLFIDQKISQENVWIELQFFEKRRGAGCKDSTVMLLQALPTQLVCSTGATISQRESLPNMRASNRTGSPLPFLAIVAARKTSHFQLPEHFKNCTYVVSNSHIHRVCASLTARRCKYGFCNISLYQVYFQTSALVEPKTRLNKSRVLGLLSPNPSRAEPHTRLRKPAASLCPALVRTETPSTEKSIGVSKSSATDSTS